MLRSEVSCLAVCADHVAQMWQVGVLALGTDLTCGNEVHASCDGTQCQVAPQSGVPPYVSEQCCPAVYTT